MRELFPFNSSRDLVASAQIETEMIPNCNKRLRRTKKKNVFVEKPLKKLKAGKLNKFVSVNNKKSLEILIVVGE